ncbi:Chitin binding domain [Trinorchestia longiramus]|nr:Chitin binding domain [Trinorchestia longiramus]
MDIRSRIMVVIFMVAACLLSCTTAAINCTDSDPRLACTSCTGIGMCLGGSYLEAETCTGGQVCVEGSCESASGTSCACDTPLAFSCDQFDSSRIAVCGSSQGSTDDYIWVGVHTCPATETCEDGKCVDPNATTTPEPTTTTTPEPTTTTTPEPTTTTTTTTLKPTTKPATCTAANANTRYPFDDDCKKYYTCREVKTNVFSYVTSTCPSVYVFNPDKKYCDLAANVPDCP